MDHIAGASLLKRHVQRVEHEIGFQVRLHQPTHDTSTPGIDDHSQVQEAARRRDVRDVGDPELVGAFHTEVTLDEVRCGPCVSVTLRRAPLLATGRTLQAGQPHQATHALVVDSPAVVPELGLHPRLAVRLSAEEVDLTHPT